MKASMQAVNQIGKQARSLQCLPRLASARSISTTTRTLNARASTSSSSTSKPNSVGNVETPGFRPRATPDASGTSSFRVGTLFTSLIALAVGVTGYGLYEYYTSFNTWPSEVRDDLRAAVKSRNRGDARRAESYFRKALATCRTLKESGNKLDPDPMLKISGVAIALAELLEQEGQVAAAYETLEDAWQEMALQGRYQVASPPTRTEKDRMRAVSIAQKLGMLGQLPEVRVEVLSKSSDQEDGAKTVRRAQLTGTSESEDPAEKWLTWSLEELFRLILPADVREKALLANENANNDSTKDQVDLSQVRTTSTSLDATNQQDQITLADLHLPPWVTKLDILASIESLGTFYASHGVPEYAVPLYLQTLSILLPKSSNPTVSERCKAGLVMNNLSQLLSATNVANATKWAQKGLKLVDETVEKAGFEKDTAEEGQEKNKTIVHSSDERTAEVRQECLGVKLTLLYNAGVLADMGGDKCQARTYFQKAYALADKTGFAAAKTKAAESLARLERRGASKS